jgi:ferric iron reductase protein FhuF
VSVSRPSTGLVPVAGAEVAAAAARAGQVSPMLGIGIGDDPDGGAGLPADGVRPDAGIGDGAAADLVGAVGDWLRTHERRVAASMVVLGYAARLLGPSVAVLLRDGILLDLRPSRVRYSFVPGRGFRLTLSEPVGWSGTADALRHRWCRDVVDDHLHSLVAAVRGVVPVATGLLWGNVASGLAGAVRTVALDGTVRRSSCHSMGLSLLCHGPLRGTGALRDDGDGLSFHRRSCCLYYRLPDGGMCGDCALLPRRGRSAQGRSAQGRSTQDRSAKGGAGP